MDGRPGEVDHAGIRCKSRYGRGAIFDQPEPKSPAANAGIQAGDVLTTINGSAVMRSSDIAAMISRMAPGSTVFLNTFRNRQMIKVSLILDAGSWVNLQISQRHDAAARSSAKPFERAPRLNHRVGRERGVLTASTSPV
jgi:serine protease Do